MSMPTILLAGRRALLALSLLVPGLLLSACGNDDAPEVEVPEEPADIGNPDLLGYWAVVEQNGEVVPQEAPIRYQFTAQGDFIRYEGDVVSRARYTFASADQITIDGPAGTRFYDYELDGNDLTLSEPGDAGERLRLTKLADRDLEDIAPPQVAVPEEDSVPADSM